VKFVVKCAGALLSLLVEPVYWSTIVICSLYHRDHITRAAFGRIKLDRDWLPVGYRLNQLWFSPVSQSEKVPQYAVNWITDSDNMEE